MFQRLDSKEFRSKRVNRPTSETQPKKKHVNLKPKRVLLGGGSKKSELALSVPTRNTFLENDFEIDRLHKGAVKDL